MSRDEQQKYLVTKGPGFLKADLFFLLLLPQKHSKGPIWCQVGGREPTNTGPACPNACLFCSAVVSIVLPAMLECPIIKGAKYCIACYYFAHIMELQNTIVVKLEPGSIRISFFLVGRALPRVILPLKSQGSPISDTAWVALKQTPSQRKRLLYLQPPRTRVH